MTALGVGALGWLWPYLRPHRWFVLAGAVAVLVQTLAMLTVPYLVKVGIDSAIRPGDTRVLGIVVAVYLALVVVRSVSGWTEEVAGARVGQQALTAVRQRLFDHVQDQSVGYHHRERPGGIVARVIGDVDALTDLLTDGLVRLASNAVVLLGVGTALVLLDWRLALSVLAVTPVLALASLWFRRASATAWRAVRETASGATVAWQDLVAGAAVTRAYGAEQRAREVLTGALSAETAANKRTVAVGSRFFPGIEFVAAAAAVVVVVHGGSRVLAGELDVGSLTAFLLYLRIAFGPVFGLSQLYDSVQAGLAGARRVADVLATEPEVAPHPDPLTIDDPRGRIVLDGVRFGYPGGDEVLHGVDLTVPAGSTVALVGETGAGKSTIARLVLRLHDPDRGTVTLDGVDVRRLADADLRRLVGYVPQESHLFQGTVAENIALAGPHGSPAPGSAEPVADAVRELGAWPLLGPLLDQEVGAAGVSLSAGQRQLIALARVWVAAPTVLVLDEATNRLDQAAEAGVRAAVRRLRERRSTLLIAHRLSTALAADLVAVVADGHIVEIGPPAELLRGDTAFAELHRHWLELEHRPAAARS